MKRRFRFLLMPLFISIIIFSCEKDDKFPKKYILDTFVDGQIKAYTNTGEITNQNTINNFIAVQKDYFWQAGYSSEDWNVEIEFLSESSAKISNSDTVVYFDLVRENGLLYFQFEGTTLHYGATADERLKHPLLSFNSWYFAIESENEIYFPFVSYIETFFSNTGDFLSSTGIGNYNNEFNTIYLNNIQNLTQFIDTIAYQDNRIVFSKK